MDRSVSEAFMRRAICLGALVFALLCLTAYAVEVKDYAAVAPDCQSVAEKNQATDQVACRQVMDGWSSDCVVDPASADIAGMQARAGMAVSSADRSACLGVMSSYPCGTTF